MKHYGTRWQKLIMRRCIRSTQRRFSVQGTKGDGLCREMWMLLAMRLLLDVGGGTCVSALVGGKREVERLKERQMSAN